jgi:ADP-heptose:LPS heptosyltransferase
MMKIAIIQPGCFGDNINSTLMLKPMRERYHEAIIDVHTTTLYASAFANNPLIDNAVTYPASQKNEALNFVHIIPDKIKAKGYDLVVNPHPMINPDKWASLTQDFGTNLICAWVRCLEDNGFRVPAKLDTILELTDAEKRRATELFARCSNSKRNVLMEVGHESGQSFWGPDWTTRVGAHLLNGDTTIFMSRKNDGHDIAQLRSRHPGKVHFVGDLTVRECAALYDHCTHFFGVSSGLTNACNTSGRKADVQWFEVINSSVVSSAPVRSDGKVFWYENDVRAFIDMLKSRGI